MKPLFLEDVQTHKHKLIDYIQKRKGKKLQYESIPKSTKNSGVKLTPSQSRLFILEQLTKKSNAYNIPFGFKIKGVLDVKASGRCIDETDSAT